MDRQLQQRVVGAAVLVALGVIFIPIFLDEGALPPAVPDAVSIPPAPAGGFSSQVVPLDEQHVERLRERALAPIPSPAESAERLAGVEATGSADTGREPGKNREKSRAADTPRDRDDGPRTGVVAWTVQLGSFANEANAKRLVDKLRAADFPAYVERRTEGGRTVFKVRVGPEIRREDAEKMRQRLAGQFDLKGMLLRYH